MIDLQAMSQSASDSDAGETEDAGVWMSSQCERSARDVERDRMREARGYHNKITVTTTDMVRKPITEGTKAFYQMMLREWNLFALEYHGPKTPTNVKTAKDFILYFSSGRKGYNEPGGRLTKSYTHGAWKAFMAAWGRQHHMSFSKSQQDTILNFINQRDGEDGPDLTDKARLPLNYTHEDFKVSLLHLWGDDEYDFVHERYRGGLHLCQLLHVNTSGRRAEYEKEWTYGHICLAMVWLDDSRQPQLIIDFRRNKAKGLQNWERAQPQHMLYELVGLPFYCNSLLFFMAAALADDVLRDYHSWDEICAIPRPAHQKHRIIEWHPDKLDWPVFPRSTRNGRLDHTRTSASLASKALLDLGYRSGFRDPLVLHAARREALLKVDNYGYSCNERMRFAGHINPNTYRQSYQTAMPLVDGQASYFGFEANNSALHEMRRGYSWRRNPHPRPKLKEAARVALREVEEDASEGAAEDDDEGRVVDRRSPEHEDRQKVYDRRRQQQGVALREQSIAAPQEEIPPYESDFIQTRKIMPERDRLATNLFCEGSLRDELGRSIMDDLITLYRSESPRTFCAGLNSSPSQCDACAEHCRAGHEQGWWLHLYRCRKKGAVRTGGFAEFCFLCFAWFEDRDQWKKHCQTHLQALPLKCNMVVFRHNVVRPGLCPACLCDGDFRQFLNLTTWRNHLHDHLLRHRSTTCVHPRCQEMIFGNKQAWLDHLADVHQVRFEVRKRAWASAVGASSQDLAFVRVEPGKAAVKKTKSSESKDTTPIQDTEDVVMCESSGVRQASSDNETAMLLTEEHGAINVAASNERISSKAQVMVIVPPVPDSWKLDEILDIENLEDLRLDLSEDNERPHAAPKQKRRGRPPGSRNQKTLRRERRQRLMLKTH